MKITVKKFVHLNADSPLDTPSFSFFECDMSEYGYIPISEQEITVEVPDWFNPIPIQVDCLKEQQRKIRAEAEAKVLFINEKIQKLLSIEAPKEVQNEAV